jgi:hypothetical protein
MSTIQAHVAPAVAHKSLMEMPWEVRVNVIEKLFEGVTIHIAPPIYLPNTSSQFHTRLELAGANKELRGQVFHHVFEMKRVPLFCAYIGEFIHYPGSADVAPLLKLITELNTSIRTLRWYEDGQRRGSLTALYLMPKLTKLTVKERINVEVADFTRVMGNQRTIFVPPLYMECVFDFISTARWELFGYHESPRSLPFEVVITVESVMGGFQVRSCRGLNSATCVLANIHAFAGLRAVTDRPRTESHSDIQNLGRGVDLEMGAYPPSIRLP